MSIRKQKYKFIYSRERHESRFNSSNSLFDSTKSIEIDGIHFVEKNKNGYYKITGYRVYKGQEFKVTVYNVDSEDYMYPNEDNMLYTIEEDKVEWKD